jgi:DNA-binding NtrC family response regulator
VTPGIEAFLASQDALARTKQSRADGAPLSTTPQTQGPRKRAKKPSLSALEDVLHECGGRVERAAERLDVRRQQIYRWMEAYGLDIDRYRSDD